GIPGRDTGAYLFIRNTRQAVEKSRLIKKEISIQANFSESKELNTDEHRFSGFIDRCVSGLSEIHVFLCVLCDFA
ncbi:MAG: hypothetical protein JXL81_14330, partial [Deltaproteobacteria bacterium]|nr:hypothetical protein [Deltaproteobacteria bacterium]